MTKSAEFLGKAKASGEDGGLERSALRGCWNIFLLLRCPGFDIKIGQGDGAEGTIDLYFQLSGAVGKYFFCFGVLVSKYTQIRRERLCGICGKVIVRCSRDCFFNEELI